MKIWRSDTKADDKIIVYSNDTIYKVNPRPEEVEQVAFDFSINKLPIKNITEVPLHYLKEIDLEDNKNYIVLLFGQDSYEHLKVENKDKRNEIFEYFKSNIPNSIFLTDNYSKIRAGKKPLIAMCVVSVIFLWAFYISTGFEKGIDYEVVGEHRSLASIVLVIASLGTKKVVLIFSSLFAVALASFIQKTKNPKVVHKIIMKR